MIELERDAVAFDSAATLVGPVLGTAVVRPSGHHSSPPTRPPCSQPLLVLAHRGKAGEPRSVDFPSPPLFLPSLMCFTTALAPWTFGVPLWPSSWPAPASTPTAAPPLHHSHRRAPSGAPMPLGVGASDAPRCRECTGTFPVTRGRTGGELTADQRPP
jgi:hypothetical protein